jgi:ribosome-interacting GTPase 1
MGIVQKIKEIEDEMARTQKNKVRGEGSGGASLTRKKKLLLCCS